MQHFHQLGRIAISPRLRRKTYDFIWQCKKCKKVTAKLWICWSRIFAKNSSSCHLLSLEKYKKQEHHQVGTKLIQWPYHHFSKMNLPHLTIVSTFEITKHTILFIEGNYVIAIPNYWNKHNTMSYQVSTNLWYIFDNLYRY